jgi:hypothetical protein
MRKIIEVVFFVEHKATWRDPGINIEYNRVPQLMAESDTEFSFRDLTILDL